MDTQTRQQAKAPHEHRQENGAGRVARTVAEQDILEQYGASVLIIHLHGMIFFGSASSVVEEVRARDGALAHMRKQEKCQRWLQQQMQLAPRTASSSCSTALRFGIKMRAWTARIERDKVPPRE